MLTTLIFGSTIALSIHVIHVCPFQQGSWYVARSHHLSSIIRTENKIYSSR